MSPENTQAKPATKDDSQSSTSRKTPPLKPPEQALRCPRCDSPNTKFCYYNNYSLTQPRHFCKTCRRYWTKGGALRNVPIGGGCRKNKKIKSSSRLSGDSKDSGESSDIGGLKFFHGLSPAMDFQLGGLSGGYNSHFASFGDVNNISSSSPAIPSNPCFGTEILGNSSPTPLMGLNFQTGHGFGGGVQNVHSNLASSIESLSSINQDLHWKLQQQRLAMLFGGEHENQKESNIVSSQRPQPMMFQNLEISKPEAKIATEWFFDSSNYPPVNPPSNNSTSNGNESSSNWNGIQAWNDLNQFSTLP